MKKGRDDGLSAARPGRAGCFFPDALLPWIGPPHRVFERFETVDLVMDPMSASIESSACLPGPMKSASQPLASRPKCGAVLSSPLVVTSV
jgi:hypothetical protein